jgi:hypothetical protein
MPLFEPDSPSQIAEEEGQLVSQQGSPSSPLPSFAGDQPMGDQPVEESPTPPTSQVDGQELQAMEEIREQFQWLVDLLAQNAKKRWGTAYRDFADVSLLLHAVGGLGMVEMGNGRVGDGQFNTSVGNFSLSLSTFLQIMNLGHSPATWRNKMTMFFRLKSLYSYSQHFSGELFELPEHQRAWGIVEPWVRDAHLFLPEGHWVTTKYGNTELRRLAKEMVQVANQGKMLLSKSDFCFCALLSLCFTRRRGVCGGLSQSGRRFCMLEISDHWATIRNLRYRYIHEGCHWAGSLVSVPRLDSRGPDSSFKRH